MEVLHLQDIIQDMEDNFDYKKYLAEGRLFENTGYVYASSDKKDLSVWTQKEFNTYVGEIADDDYDGNKSKALNWIKNEQNLTKLPNSPYLFVFADNKELDFIAANTKEEFVDKVDEEYYGELKDSNESVDVLFGKIKFRADDSSRGFRPDTLIVIEKGKIVGGNVSHVEDFTDLDFVPRIPNYTDPDEYNRIAMKVFGKKWRDITVDKKLAAVDYDSELTPEQQRKLQSLNLDDDDKVKYIGTLRYGDAFTSGRVKYELK